MPFRRDHDPSAEAATDALVDGDQALATGTAMAALRAPRLPGRLGRHLRVEHRHLDAERAARRVRVAAHPRRVVRRARLLRPARPAALPRPARRHARRHPRPAEAAHLDAARAGRLLRAPRGAGRRRTPEPVGDLLLRARDRHRQRAERPGDRRAAPDARPPRGPARRGLAAVRADEPVPGHRPGDRRAALRRLRHRHRLRPQRADLRLRDRQPPRRHATPPGPKRELDRHRAHPLPLRASRSPPPTR